MEISEAPDYYDHIKYPMGKCLQILSSLQCKQTPNTCKPYRGRVGMRKGKDEETEEEIVTGMVKFNRIYG